MPKNGSVPMLALYRSSTVFGNAHEIQNNKLQMFFKKIMKIKEMIRSLNLALIPVYNLARSGESVLVPGQKLRYE